MRLIPSIDIQAGRCVRLSQGQFDQVSVYEMTPAERAGQYADAGAKRIHVVDLDGAKNGCMQALSWIDSLIQAGVDLQVGGGVRSLDTVLALLRAGVSSVVLGSVAITDPSLMAQIITAVGANRLVLAVDVVMQNALPMVVFNGWQERSAISLWAVLEHYQALGVTTVLCTDQQCDGLMQGPNFNLYKEALQRFPDLNWQASGGIRDQRDLDQLADFGLGAAILGRTLYEGGLDMLGE